MISRRRFLTQVTSAGVVLALAPRALAAPDDLVLVLHAKNTTSPDTAAAKRLFVGESVYWPGNLAVHPVVRPADLPAGDRFFRTISMTPARFKRLWQEKQLSGQGIMPETIAAATAMIAKIAADPGAIGIALASEVPAGAAGVRTVAFV